ncbi:MAG TPA: flagellar assembly protein FliW [Alphaproteobacteria bacterium]|jgi:flagellar assembly factor FliW|nr:flagellar assembly protein FliW [Alphaproteobacteria bacterium]
MYTHSTAHQAAHAKVVAPVAAPEGDMITVPTMFGPMTFARDALLTLPAGLIGMPGKKTFGLGDMPDASYGNFKLLQCIEQPELAFLVLPLEFLPDRIGAADVAEALTALAVPAEQAALLLIVTARKNDGHVTLTANLRAPVVVNRKERVARQYVMPNSAYEIRHVL